MSNGQLDLFGMEPAARGKAADIAFEPPPESFVDGIRKELLATLAKVRAADQFPWPDLTQMTLGEMRFHSIATWLPKDEAKSLRDAFEVEMTRLYEAWDRRAEEQEANAAD